MSESPLVKNRQRIAQSRPRAPSASAPTARKSGTARSGSRVAAEIVSASFSRAGLTTRGIVQCRISRDARARHNRGHRADSPDLPLRGLGQLRATGRGPGGKGEPGSGRSYSHGRGLRGGGGGGGGGFTSLSPPLDL